MWPAPLTFLFCSALTLLLLFHLLRRATADIGYAASLTLLLAAANAFHVAPFACLAAVLFLGALTLVSPGCYLPIAVGIGHGLACLVEFMNVVLVVPAVDAVLRRPAGGGTGSPRKTAPTRPVALLLYAAAFLAAGGMVYLWPILTTDPQAGMAHLKTFLLPMDLHGPGPVWFEWQSLHASIEGMFLADPPSLSPAVAGGGTEITLDGLRTLLRALLLGLLVGPLFSRPQIDRTETVRRLARGSLLYLAVFLPAWLLPGTWASHRIPWLLPPILALVGIAYSRSHPAGRIAGHHAVVGVIGGIALLLGLHNLLARFAG